MTGQRYWRDAQETFKAITVWLASGTEAAAALIIGLAAIEGTIRALWLFVPGTAGHGEPETMGTLSQHHILRQDARGVHEMPTRSVAWTLRALQKHAISRTLA